MKEEELTEWSEGRPCSCKTLRHHLKLLCGANSGAMREVERLQEGLRAILQEHTPDPEFPETHPWARCTICSPQEERWPCSTVLEARAALEEGE